MVIFSTSLALVVRPGDSNVIRCDFYRPSKANKIINVAAQILAIKAGQAKKQNNKNPTKQKKGKKYTPLLTKIDNF